MQVRWRLSVLSGVMVRRPVAGLLVLLLGCAEPAVVFESEAPFEIDRWWRWTFTLSEGEMISFVLPWEGEELWNEAALLLYGDCFEAQMGRVRRGLFNVEADLACPIHAQLRFPETICEMVLVPPTSGGVTVVDEDELECEVREDPDSDWFVSPGYSPPSIRYD